MKLSGSCRAFTLMEVLVTVAILAILVGLSFPIYSSLRSQAEQNQSLSNIKQLTAMLIGVASMDRAKLPAARDTSKPSGQWAWHYRLVEAGYFEYNSVGEMLASESVFHCPVDVRAIDDGRSPNRPSYAMNSLVSSTGGIWAPYRLISNQEKAASTILLAEIWGNRDNRTYSNVSFSNWREGEQTQAAFDRHSGGANYSFVDGHVEYLKLDEAVDGANGGEGHDYWRPAL